jgi:hypothetical protein
MHLTLHLPCTRTPVQPQVTRYHCGGMSAFRVAHGEVEELADDLNVTGDTCAEDGSALLGDHAARPRRVGLPSNEVTPWSVITSRSVSKPSAVTSWYSGLLGEKKRSLVTLCSVENCSPAATSLRSPGRRVVVSAARCRAQRADHPLVMLDPERCCTATRLTGRYMPPAQARPKRSTMRRVVKDHASHPIGPHPRRVPCSGTSADVPRLHVRRNR